VYPSAMHPWRPLSLPSRIVLGLAGLLGIAAIVGASHASADRLERRLYDAYLSLGRSVRQPSDLVVVSPEGGNGDRIVTEDESRAVFRLLGEFGARRIALVGSPIEGSSPGELLASLHAQLPGVVDREFGTIEENVRALFGGIRTGSVPPKELDRYVELLAETIRASGVRIKDAADAGSRESLTSFEEAFAPAFVAADSFIGASADSDGVLRSVRLVKTVDGQLVSSFELSSLKAYLGASSMDYSKGNIVLGGCSFPGGATRELSIAVDGEARTPLGRPRGLSKGGLRKLALEDVRAAVREENELVARLEKMEAEGDLEAEGLVLLSRYRRAELLRSQVASGAVVAQADWKEAREAFFLAAQSYFKDSLPTAAPAPAPASEADADADAEKSALFEDCRDLVSSLAARRSFFAQSLSGSFVYLSVDGGAAKEAEVAAIFAAEALAKRLPAASLAVFKRNLSILLALLSIIMTAVALFVGRVSPRRRGGPTSREPGAGSAGGSEASRPSSPGI
jgi:hypothetical protein